MSANFDEYSPHSDLVPFAGGHSLGLIHRVFYYHFYILSVCQLGHQATEFRPQNSYHRITSPRSFRTQDNHGRVVSAVR